MRLTTCLFAAASLGAASAFAQAPTEVIAAAISSAKANETHLIAAPGRSVVRLQAARLGVLLVELMEQTHGTFGQNFRWAWRWPSWRRPWRVWLRRRHASRRGSAPTSGCAKRGVSDMPRSQRAGCAFLPAVRWILDCHGLHPVRYRGTARREVLRAVWQGD